MKHYINKRLRKPNLRLASALLFVIVSVFAAVQHVNHSSKVQAATADSTNPCVSAAAPSQWKHVVVLMFENKTYSSVIGSSSAPYTTQLANKCGSAYSGTSGSAPKNNWHDANFKVDGTSDGSYVSKPSYATLTSGVPPSVHGLRDDSYTTTSSVDNIYNRLNLLGKDAKNYYSGSASSTPCSSSNFSGAYHDAIRYYTNLGGQSTNTSTYCNTHDKPLSTFMTDVNNGTLPAFSMILPTNSENMHDNSITSGDTWAQNFLSPLFDSAQYKSGDTAVFYIWDEDTAIPNVLIAPSIVPGSRVPAPSGNPISHFAALRTWQEMLGVSPLLGDTGQAPSMLSFFNGGGAPPTDNPPTATITAPASGASITAGTQVNVTANAADDKGVSQVSFYVDNSSTPANTDTTAPYGFTWNTTSLTAGTHTLRAVATDTIGQQGTSSTVTVTIVSGSGCTPVSTSLGTATATFNVPASTTYHVWSRIQAPDSTNNSYYLQLDTSCPVNIGDASTIPANTWTWVNYKDGSSAAVVDVTLTAGTHTLTMIGKEAGVRVDRIEFLSDTCTPTGTGDNCTVTDSTGPTVSVTLPASGATISGTSQQVAANAVDNTGGTGVAGVNFYYNGTNAIGTATAPASGSTYQVNWDTTTVPDGTYSLTAKATDKAGNFTVSNPVSVTVKNADTAAPSTPTGLQTTKNAYNEVDLAWGASTDTGGSGLAGYHVYRNGTLLATVTTTSYKDTTVAANTAYTYAVDAFDKATPANVSAKASISVTTPQAPDTTAPSAPSNLQVTKNAATEVDLTWGASTDTGGSGLAGYYVRRNNVVISPLLTTTSYADTSVTASTTYTYDIIAVDNAFNASNPSNIQSITTPSAPDISPPSTPANLAAVASSTQINLTWTGSTDTGGSGLAGYYVFRNGVRFATVATTSFSDATAQYGQTYEYHIVAFDAANNQSAASNSVQSTLLPTPPPTILSFEPTDDAVVNKRYPDKALGLNTAINTDASPVHDMLLKFTVKGIGNSTLTSAKLQLWVNDSSDVGGKFYAVYNNSWQESTVTWNNSPAASTNLLGTLGQVTRSQYTTIDLPNFITGDGTYSLRVSTTSLDLAGYASRNAKTTSRHPLLTVTAQ